MGEKPMADIKNRKSEKTIEPNWFDGINSESVMNATSNDEFMRLPEPDEIGIHIIVKSEPSQIKTKNGNAFIVDVSPLDISTGETKPLRKLILPKSLLFNMATSFARKNDGNYKQPLINTKWRVWSDDSTGQKFYKCEMI